MHTAQITYKDTAGCRLETFCLEWLTDSGSIKHRELGSSVDIDQKYYKLQRKRTSLFLRI